MRKCMSANWKLILSIVLSIVFSFIMTVFATYRVSWGAFLSLVALFLFIFAVLGLICSSEQWHQSVGDAGDMSIPLLSIFALFLLGMIIWYLDHTFPAQVPWNVRS